MAEQRALTPKQAAFVAEYLIDLNATKAAIRAGYSPRTAYSQAFDLLKKPEIERAIAAAQQERAKRTEITQDRVLQEIARIAFFDLRKLYREDGSLRQPHELGDDAAAVLAGVDVVEMAGGGEFGGDDGAKHVPMFTKKAKVFDKVAALTLAARHLGMLTDKTELTGKGGGPVQIVATPHDENL